MRKHSLRRSYSSQHLIISDSQLRDLSFPNCNILSISGGIISDVAQLHVPQDVTLLALFIGANNAFTRKGLLTSQTPLEIARELSKLADTLCEKISKVYVFVFPATKTLPTPNGPRPLIVSLKSCKENLGGSFEASQSIITTKSSCEVTTFIYNRKR